jgi:hypothetical protein
MKIACVHRPLILVMQREHEPIFVCSFIQMTSGLQLEQ